MIVRNNHNQLQINVFESAALGVLEEKEENRLCGLKLHINVDYEDYATAYEIILNIFSKYKNINHVSYEMVYPHYLRDVIRNQIGNDIENDDLPVYLNKLEGVSTEGVSNRLYDDHKALYAQSVAQDYAILKKNIKPHILSEPRVTIYLPDNFTDCTGDDLNLCVRMINEISQALKKAGIKTSGFTDAYIGLNEFFSYRQDKFIFTSYRPGKRTGPADYEYVPHDKLNQEQKDTYRKSPLVEFFHKNVQCDRYGRDLLQAGEIWDAEGGNDLQKIRAVLKKYRERTLFNVFGLFRHHISLVEGWLNSQDLIAEINRFDTFANSRGTLHAYLACIRSRLPSPPVKGGDDNTDENNMEDRRLQPS